MDSKPLIVLAKLSKVTALAALLSFAVLLFAPSQWLSGAFLVIFGVYAILKSLGTYHSKNVYLVTGRTLHGRRAQITSILDVVIGMVVLAVGLFTLVGDFLLPN